jgi:hypothetical protein
LRPSSAIVLAVKPRVARTAAITPLRAACPACSGLVIVPKLTAKLDASDALMPTAVTIAAGEAFKSFAQATAAAIVPTVPVECQPVFAKSGHARSKRIATSKPIVYAAKTSAGVECRPSAMASSAGTSAAVG